MIDIFTKRIILENRKAFIAINILFTLTIVLFTLAIYAYFYGFSNYNEYAKNTKLEDFQFGTYTPLSDEEVSNLEDEYDLVIDYRQKYVYRKEDGEQLTIFSHFNNENISHPVITQGRGIENNSEIVLNKEYAKANGLEVGEYIKIEDKQYEIVGLGSFVNMMYPIADGSLFPNNKKIGEAYVSKEDFARIQNPQNYYVGKFNEQLSKSQKDDIYEQIKEHKEIEMPITDILGNPKDKTVQMSNISYLFDRSENFSLSVVSLEYEFLSVIIGGLAILICVISIILTSFIFNSILKRSRREIGIARAEGYYVLELQTAFSKYFSYGLVVSIVIGTILGTVFAIALEYLYSTFFNILYYKADAILFIVLILGNIFIFLIMNFFMSLVIRKKLDKNVLELINNTDEENVSKSLKSNKSNKMYKINFSTRMKVNTILKNKGKTMLLAYGVFFSSFLFIFGFLFITAFLNMEDNIRGEYYTYDYEVKYSKPHDDEKLNNQNAFITFQGELYKINNKLTNNNDYVSVVGISPENDYIEIPLEILQDNEVIITSKLANDYSLKIGDVFTIVNPLDNSESYEFEVTSIMEVDYESKIYTSREYLQNLFGVDDSLYNGLVGRGKDKETLLSGDENASYYSYDELIKGVKDYSLMSAVAIIYIATIAGIISLITMTTISNIIISSKRKQIAIMKVFGYTSKEISNFTFSSYKWIILAVYVVCYPVSVVFIENYIKLIMSLIPDMTFPLIIKPSLFQFIMGLIYIFAIYYISSYLTLRKINAIKLSESIKRDE